MHFSDRINQCALFIAATLIQVAGMSLLGPGRIHSLDEIFPWRRYRAIWRQESRVSRRSLHR